MNLKKLISSVLPLNKTGKQPNAQNHRRQRADTGLSNRNKTTPALWRPVHFDCYAGCNLRIESSRKSFTSVTWLSIANNCRPSEVVGLIITPNKFPKLNITSFTSQRPYLRCLILSPTFNASTSFNFMILFSQLRGITPRLTSQKAGRKT